MSAPEKKLMTMVESDKMFDFGARVLGSASKVFLEEARARNLDEGDAVLLFCSVLVHTAVRVLCVLTPGDTALQLVLNLVRQTWEDNDGREPQN